MAQPLILASASPRRKQLLEQLGLQVAACLAADIDESIKMQESATVYVQRLALEKAQAIAKQHPKAIVLAADTCISIDGQIIGKPLDFYDACQIWQQLAQRWHQVLTAVCIYANGQYYAALNTSDVYFAQLSAEQMQGYWQSGEPQDKAGAYAIQGLAAQWISEIRGSYSAIMGLPLYETAQLLSQAGVKLDHE